MDQVQTISNQTLEQKITGILTKFPVILQLCRFAAIGVLNTALDFIILNAVSKTFGITSGFSLGQINIVGFSAAVIQSYFWNRYWAFGEMGGGVLKNFIRLVMVGVVGAAAMAAVLLGAGSNANSLFYLFVLVVFILVQFGLWKNFGLFHREDQNASTSPNQPSTQFASFIVVSIIGLVINSALLALITKNYPLSENLDLNKNIAKILATFISLVWNFIGYKLVVFKK